MSSSEVGSATTKDRILAAASEVFTEVGFEKATVRAICAKAEANVAGVNYHFRDKRELYRQVLRSWQQEAEQRFPFDAGLDAEAPLEARLQCFYRAMLMRIFCGTGEPGQSHGRAKVWLGELVSSGCQRSGESEDNYCRMEGFIRPLVEGELGSAKELLVRDVVDSCLAQIVTYFVGFVYDPEQFLPLLTGDEEVERVARHMTKFAVGGIRAMREAVDEAR